MSKPPVSEQVQVNFRMPSDLRDRIRTAAEANNRSMNAEIVATLDERYPAPFTTRELHVAFREAVESNEELERALRRWLRQREQERTYRSDYDQRGDD